MKNLILIILFALPSIADAQNLLNIFCEECRDLTTHPEDARNFSYNQVFGSSSWLTVDQADRFRITDSFGTTVTIDMNVEFQINLFAGDLLELGGLGGSLADDLQRLLVNGMIIQIRVIYRNLDIEEYLFTREDVQGDLPVGDTNTRSGLPDSGSDEPDDGFNDAADYEYEDTVDDVECDTCTMQVIYEDGSLSDPYELWTDEELDEMWEL